MSLRQMILSLLGEVKEAQKEVQEIKLEISRMKLKDPQVELGK